MFRTSSWTALGAAFGLSAPVACAGGGEAEQSQAGAGEMAAPPTAQPAEATTPPMAQQESSMKLPEGVTVEMIDQGKQIYAGAGLCYVCHGPEGEGMPGLGASLADKEWVHSDGSYEGIAKSILNGVEASKSTSGTAMPAKGGSGITDEQVKAVAAFVYKLSN